MISGMKYYVKNVDIKVEASLMTRWAKEAEQIIDANGNYQFWVPELQAEEETNTLVDLLI